jgi:hypothetical protein
MIDPDNIQISENNLPDHINIRNVPYFETQVYDLDDDKDLNHYFKDIEKEVRQSFEYREFIKYIRENMNMDKCAFINGVSNQESFDIKIEIHHYPFSLRDITEIVYRKRAYYNESVDIEMVAKEVMELHYKLIVGLIPLSETVHELVHNGRLFIPSDVVMGRYNIFVDYYKPFCAPEQLEVLERIEKYSEEKTSYLYNTSVIEENRVQYNVTDDKYKLPEFQQITDNMIHQLENIKANNYLLPTVNDKVMEPPQLKQPVDCPIEFIDPGDTRVLIRPL